MLNLTIVMLACISPRPRAAALFLVFAIGFAALALGFPRLLAVSAQAPEATPTSSEQAAIHAPAAGEALQGVVSIRGSSSLPGFRAAELAFAYQTDPTNTWFPIQQSVQPVIDGPLAVWDTTTITDGNYRLRLLVYLADGQVAESVVSNLRVRNYSPVETSAPAQPAANTLDGPRPTATYTAAPLPDFQPAADRPSLQSTPAPTNPAQITRADLGGSALRGALLASGGLLLVAAYMGLRALLRR